MRIAPRMGNGRHLDISVFAQGYWTVHSMTASFTIESCLESCLQVMVMPGFGTYESVLPKHYRAKRWSFQ